MKYKIIFILCALNKHSEHAIITANDKRCELSNLPQNSRIYKGTNHNTPIHLLCFVTSYVGLADAANMMLIYFIITIIFTLPYLCSFEPNLHCL